MVNRAMAAMLARAGSRIFVAAEAWKTQLARYAPRGTEIGWLPVPSTIEVNGDRVARRAARALYAAPDATLLGHFGTYGPLVAARLEPVLVSILGARSDLRILLIGRNGESFRAAFIARNRAFAERVFATGTLAQSAVSNCIGACDLMIQPYPDGITSRNTSALASLLHRKPIATTSGRFTEKLWRESGAVMLAPDNDAASLAHCAVELIDNRERANAMGCAAAKLYRDVFDVQHTIDALRAA
jgi:glycosyltransferase involved in cell wall biosynthesis